MSTPLLNATPHSPLATILAVDDTPESLMLLNQILTAAHYQVRTADSGELALAAIAVQPPDLILLDVRMPGLDGLEVCRRLKASEQTRHIPVILISAFAEVKDAVQGLQLGAADYVCKPVQVPELLARVHTHLSLSRARASAAKATALQDANVQLLSEIVRRQQAEADLRQTLDAAERTRRSLLSALEDRRHAEAALRESELRLRQAATAGNIGLWDWDLRTNQVYYSPEWKSQIGYAEHEISNDFSEWQSRVHPDDLARSLQAVQEQVAHPKPDFAQEFRLRHKDGSYRWIIAQAAVQYDEQCNPVRMLGSHVDITSRKQAEEQVARTLAEKEVLLKEIHHRVKNNLQIISGLLHMQAERVADPWVREAMKESQSRIRSMALVHEQLYQSADLAQLNFKAYVQSLVAHLFRSHLPKGRVVRFDLRMGEVRLDLNSAIACGLLISELVTNALKHAFSADQATPDNTVLVAWEDAGEQWRLVVADNGGGMAGGVDWVQPRTLGLRLVQMLAQQLKGAARLESGPGCRFVVEFLKS